VNRNFPTKLITALVVFRGLGLRYIKIEQGIESVNLLISLCDSQLLSKFLLRETVELMQVESGLNAPIL